MNSESMSFGGVLSKRRSRLPAYPYVMWMALFVVIPIILVVIYAFTTSSGNFSFDNFAHMTDYASVFGRSLWLAFIATFICLIIGYPVAYVLSKTTVTTQRIMMMLIMLPMWINFLLRTYAWMSLLENTGLINRLLLFLGLPTMHIINTEGAVVLGMVYNYLPFMILPIFSVLIKIDKSIIEAAQDLGANSVWVFLKIVFPLSLTGVLSGITMVFVPSVSTFIISRLLGGGTKMMLGDLIEMQFLGSAYNPHLGAAISLIMMIIVIICISIMSRFGEGEEQAVIM